MTEDAQLKWEELPRGELQVRDVEIREGKITKYEVVQGDLWLSGYDERAQLLIMIDADKLVDGQYVIFFRPVGLEQGMDAIEDFKIRRPGIF